MKKRRIFNLILIAVALIIAIISFESSYSKYVIVRNMATSVSSEPFYFEVKNNTERIYVNQGDQTVSLNIKNYIDGKYNFLETDYSISLLDNEFFTFNPIDKNIESSRYDENIDLRLIPKEGNTKTGGSITIVVKTSKPYLKEVKVVVPIGTLGQYVLDIAEGKRCLQSYPDISAVLTDQACDGNNQDDLGNPIYDIPPYNKYLSGTSDCMDFNYVWYSGKMWRVTEVYPNGDVKIISENILSAIDFGETDDWETSYMKQWLNEDFLDTLYNYNNLLVTNAKWDFSSRYDWCWVNPPKQVSQTVGLLTLYEYSKAKTYSSTYNNYLNLGHSWWLISPIGGLGSGSVGAVRTDGNITGYELPATSYGIRPVVVLKAGVNFTGKGTIEDPITLLDDIQVPKEYALLNTRVSGELVNVDGMLYRIVSTQDYSGKKVTKLSAADYIRDEDGNVVLKEFGSMSMHSYADVVNSGDEQYWGAYLNGSWITPELKKYIVKDTYYVNSAQDYVELGSRIGSYKNTICKEQDTTETTKKCEKTDKIWTGYVGLPIIGELFAYPLGGNEIEDYAMATMTPFGNGDFPMVGAFSTSQNGVFQFAYSEKFAVKPSITLSEDVIIKSGDGKTPKTAFEIALPNE